MSPSCRRARLFQAHGGRALPGVSLALVFGAFLIATPARAQSCGDELIRSAMLTCGAQIARDPIGCVLRMWRSRRGSGRASAGNSQTLRQKAQRIRTLVEGIARALSREVGLDAARSVVSQLRTLASRIVTGGVGVLTRMRAAVERTVDDVRGVLRELASAAGQSIAGTSRYRDMRNACSGLADKFRVMKSVCRAAVRQFSVTSPVQSANRIKGCLRKAHGLARQAGHCGPAAQRFAVGLPAAGMRAAGQLAARAVRMIGEVFERARSRFNRLREEALSTLRREPEEVARRVLQEAGQQIAEAVRRAPRRGGDIARRIADRIRSEGGDLIARSGQQLRETVRSIITPVLSRFDTAVICSGVGSLVGVCRCAVDTLRHELIRFLIQFVAREILPRVRAAIPRVAQAVGRALARLRRGARRLSSGASELGERAQRGLLSIADQISDRALDAIAAGYQINLERQKEKRGNAYRSFSCPRSARLCLSACGRSDHCQAFSWNAGRCRLMRHGERSRDNQRSLSGQKAGGIISSVVRGVAGRRLDDVVTGVQEVLRGVANMNCNQVVQGMSRFELFRPWYTRFPGVQTCRVAFSQGFICRLPNSLGQLAGLAAGVARAAWDNPGTCLAAGLFSGPAFPAGVMWCGLYHYLRPRIRRVGNCLARLFTGRFWADLFTHVWRWAARLVAPRQGPSPSLETRLRNMGQAVVRAGRSVVSWAIRSLCSYLGGLAFDLVLAIVSGGSSAAASAGATASEATGIFARISAWISSLLDKLPLLGRTLQAVRPLRELLQNPAVKALGRARMANTITRYLRRYVPQCEN